LPPAESVCRAGGLSNGDTKGGRGRLLSLPSLNKAVEPVSVADGYEAPDAHDATDAAARLWNRKVSERGETERRGPRD